MTGPPGSRVLAFPGCAIGVLLIGGCLLAAAVNAREGDLDPAFGDVGRVGPIASHRGIAWSMAAMPDGSLMMGGGDTRSVCPSNDPGCYDWGPVGYSATSFLIRVSAAGHIVDELQLAALADVQLFAVARQPDGKFVVAGRKLFRSSLDSQLVVYRLNGNGTLDATFGEQGLVQLRPEDRGVVDDATAVLVQADGRIIVGGSRRPSLPGCAIRWCEESRILIRLLANGAFDATFGVSGIAVVAQFGNSRHGGATDITTRMQVVRTATGGYRVTAKSDAGCQVIGVTGDGAIDPAFGTSGIVQIDLPRPARSFVLAEADGQLVVAGDDYENAFVRRLLAGGQPDPGFSATAVHDLLLRVTALAFGPDGTIVVAGKAKLSALQARAPTPMILRLRTNGELDESFGNAGSTEIDMPSNIGSDSVLHDMRVGDDGAVLAAGGDLWSDKPILVRLLGADGGDGPGVLGVTLRGVLFVHEEVGDVILEVRRTGGDAGHTSVAYQAVVHEEARSATVGEDFLVDAGRFEWEDGDTTTRQIPVRIIDDDLPEDREQISVLLTDAEGGVGLGTKGAIVEIYANDGPVAPQRTIALAASHAQVSEGGSINVAVVRTGSSAGALTVDYHAASGTATAGTDFTSSSGTLTWADGDTANKIVRISTLSDATDESDETFTVTLSNPSAGATLGSITTATVTISDDASSGGSSAGDGTGGGGRCDLLSLLALLLFGIARKRALSGRNPVGISTIRLKSPS